MASSVSAAAPVFIAHPAGITFHVKLIELFAYIGIDLGSLSSTALVALNHTCADAIETHRLTLERLPSSFITMEGSPNGVLIKVKEMKDSSISFITIAYNPEQAKQWFHVTRNDSTCVLFDCNLSIECGMDMDDAKSFLAALISEEGYIDPTADSEEPRTFHLAK
jgi:hypothetical protein